ncbi:MAG: YfhO family protein, partial [Blastocatellia bacterium]
HMGHTSRIAAAVWAPWILLAIENLYERLSWRWVALGAAFIALQLFAGEPQMNFYTALVCGAYTLFSLLLREERERRRKFLFGAAAMSICGALLSAVQLLPERELLKMGERAAISYEYFSGYSFPPANILTFVFPFFFGGGTLPSTIVPYWGLWTVDETCGYFGLLTLLLALVALFGSRRRSLAWFWGGTALVSLALSFGDYLPFGLNHVLHGTPVYNLFRASGRHMYEFTFSLATLAGLGASYIAQSERKAVGRALRRGSIVFVAMVAVTIIVYRFFGDYLLVGPVSRVPGADSLANYEAWVPMVFAALSLGALWIFARRRNGYGGALMVVVVFADLAFFSLAFNWGWREFLTGVSARLQDPPAVQFIKSREADLNSFRVVSYAPRPYGYNYDELNLPNVSIARGLQSVNGYDALRLIRHGAVSGDMGSDGMISDPSVFDPAHQGLNMLNAKYALRLSAATNDQKRIVEIEGVRFDEELLSLSLTPGAKAEISLAGVSASELALVSTMSHSIHIPDDTPMVGIRIHAKDGRVIELDLKAGRDTAEWAYDNEEVRAAIKHRRPKVAESFPADGFPSNRYLARLPFERAEIERIEFNYLAPDASVLILRAALIDSKTGATTILSPIHFQTGRWRMLAAFEEVEVYENLKALPRAWFARRAAADLSAGVLRTIRTGAMKDGSAFDPAETVLFEKEDFGAREVVLPRIGDPANARAKVTRYEPQRIEIETRNGQPGFLVLSEMYYRGWEAWIDGRRAPVERVNYVLRGLAVPAGDHRIEFVFRAPSFRNGAAYTLLGVLLLLVSAGGRRSGAGRIYTRIKPKLKGPAARMTVLLRSKLKGPADRALAVIKSALRIFSPPRLIVIAAVVGLLIYGYFLVSSASYAVGGTDSSGYARIARSILKGGIVQRVSEMDLLGLPNEFILNFIPLAYNPGPRPGTMTPFYPVGFPLLIAAGALIGGWEYGPFLVSPVCAVLSLVLIYLIGLELGLSRVFSIAGAMMLAASPTFIYMGLQPMGDVAATCLSLVTIWASLRSGKRDGWALLAGAAFGLNFLIRPTNILLLIPMLFCLRLKPRTLLFFFLGGLPLAAIFFTYNATAYGHPLRTGYGEIGLQHEIMFSGFTARFNHYYYWIKVTMSPLPLLCWLFVLVDRKVDWRNRAMLISWFGAFFLFYACYDIYDAWWYTRFLLPGYPAMILGALVVVRDLAGLLGKLVSEGNRARLRWVALAILLAVTLSHERRYIRRLDVFNFGPGEFVHSASCRWADRMIPSQSLVVSMQMSGALKFYTGRPIVRWDGVEPAQWPVLKNRAAEKGYRWYALLLPFEVEDARKQLSGKWVQVGTFNQVSLWQIEPA